MPRVSVLMPVYNVNKQYLRESIESILNQTFTDYEFIIIDDGSDENIEDIVNSYNDSRIRFYRNEKNLGVAKTRNRLLDLATGEYLANQDADDISLPERLQTMVDFLDNNPNVGVCGCNIKMIPENNELHYPEHVDFLGMLNGGSMANPTLMFRKEILEKYSLKYDEAFVSAEDYNLLSKLIKVCNLYNIQKVLLHYRNTAGSLSKNPITHLYDNKTKNEMIIFLTKDPILQKKILKLVNKHYNKTNFFKWLFSITNYYTGIEKHKCIQACGIKIKFYCKQPFWEDK